MFIYIRIISLYNNYFFLSNLLLKFRNTMYSSCYDWLKLVVKCHLFSSQHTLFHPEFFFATVIFNVLRESSFGSSLPAFYLEFCLGQFIKKLVLEAVFVENKKEEIEKKKGEDREELGGEF